MRRVGSPKLGLRHSTQKENPDAGFWCLPVIRTGRRRDRGDAPDNQAAIRGAAVGSLAASLGEERRITVPPPTSAAEQAIGHMPFPVGAIQVDGSYEFKAEFEQAWQARGNPPVRTAAQPAVDQGALERCYGSCVTNSTPATNCPAPSKP